MSAEDASGGAGDWCTVESDPGVFTEMLETIGCAGVELEELYSLDDDSLAHLCDQCGSKVYGLVFLFKWVAERQSEHAATSATSSKMILDEDAIPPGLFFAHQVTTNACATQAILSVVLNAPEDDVDAGTTLMDLKSFTVSFPPHLKGVAITSSDGIRTAHNSFSRQDAFLQEGKVHLPSDSDEAFHFVAYVPHEGSVYELDGLQKGPIAVGTYDDPTATTASTSVPSWLVAARSAIQDRMTAGGDHIKFNLMAVTRDKRIVLQEKLAAVGNDDDAELMARLAAETAKRDQWKVENQRRRHNYVPLCVQLLKELGHKGSLSGLIKEAQERQAAKQQAKKEKAAASAKE